MFQDFNRVLTSTTLGRVWLQIAPEVSLSSGGVSGSAGIGRLSGCRSRPTEDYAAGGGTTADESPLVAAHPSSFINKARAVAGKEQYTIMPVLWDIVVGTEPPVSGNPIAIDVQIRWSVGLGQQIRTYTLGDTARRWRARAIQVEVWAAVLVAGQTANLLGGAAWGAGASGAGGGSPVLGTHRLASITLSYAQANTDGAIASVAALGASQIEARRFYFTAGALTGGTAMVPATVTFYGERFDSGMSVPLGSMVVTDGIDGGNSLVVDVMPGQYDTINYQVTGFPSGAGESGSTTLQAWEEIDSEGC